MGSRRLSPSRTIGVQLYAITGRRVSAIPGREQEQQTGIDLMLHFIHVFFVIIF